MLTGDTPDSPMRLSKANESTSQFNVFTCLIPLSPPPLYVC